MQSFLCLLGSLQAMDKEMYFLGYPAVYFLDKNLKIRSKMQSYYFPQEGIENYNAKRVLWQLEVARNVR